MGRLEIVDEHVTLIAENGQRLFVLVPNDVLTNLGTKPTDLVAFSGTVTPRAEENDASKLRTLELLSATSRGEDEVN